MLSQQNNESHIFCNGSLTFINGDKKLNNDAQLQPKYNQQTHSV